MNKIIKLRKKIDVIDNDLLKLINKRSSLAMQIGKAKKEYEKMTQINNVTFIGMGLINSSLARTLKKKNFYKHSVAISRRKSTIKKIKKLKIVDRVESDYKKAVEKADLIIIGVPVNAYESILEKIKNYLKPDVIITDVGSVKSACTYSISLHILASFGVGEISNDTTRLAPRLIIHSEHAKPKPPSPPVIR